MLTFRDFDFFYFSKSWQTWLFIESTLPYIFDDISKSIHHTEMVQLSSESWHQDVSNEWCSIAVRSLLSPQRPKMYLGCFFLVRPLHILNIYKGIFFAFLYVWNIDYAFLEEERVQYRENMELYIVYYISKLSIRRPKRKSVPSKNFFFLKGFK